MARPEQVKLLFILGLIHQLLNLIFAKAVHELPCCRGRLDCVAVDITRVNVNNL